MFSKVCCNSTYLLPSISFSLISVITLLTRGRKQKQYNEENIKTIKNVTLNTDHKRKDFIEKKANIKIETICVRKTEAAMVKSNFIGILENFDS
jgi:hypothetical protein